MSNFGTEIFSMQRNDKKITLSTLKLLNYLQQENINYLKFRYMARLMDLDCKWVQTFQLTSSMKARTGISPGAYNFTVENVNFLITFKPKLYKYPKNNFGLKIIGKYKWIKMTGFDWSITT